MPSVSAMTTQTVAKNIYIYIQNVLAGFTVINSVRNICLTASFFFELFTILPTRKITHTHSFNETANKKRKQQTEP